MPRTRAPRTIYSFDVYDTCLTRVYARPTDLFYALAGTILREYGEPTKEDIHELVRARVAAERCARTIMPAADLSLADIYRHFSSPPTWSVDPDRMAALELELERRSVQPVPAMVQRIRALRETGHRIVFISDMYLPGTFIRELLVEHGLARPDDPVYVSGDIGAIKPDGGLFRHVLQDLGISPRDLIHTGDNAASDIVAARDLGIKAEPFTEAVPNDHEKRLACRPANPCPAHSLLGGISRIARLPEPGDTASQQALRAIAADHIAPLLVAFTAWVLRDAMERGIPRLHFVSRDGQILHRIAARLITHSGFTDAPELRYLYGSRQAWFLPGIFDEDIANLDWLVVPGHSCAPADLLRKFDLAPDNVCSSGAFAGRGTTYWTTQLSPAELARFRQELSRPDITAQIRENAQTSRSLLREYLAGEGVSAENPPVLVDIGWTLKAQRSLSRILAGPQTCDRVEGYYLGLSMAALPPAQSGPRRAFLIERERYLDPQAGLNFLFRNANCVEQVFTMADHGRCTGYVRKNGTVEPVLTPAPSDSRHESAVGVLQSTILRYADLAGEARLFAAGSSNSARVAALSEAALDAAKAFLTAPDPGLARVLAAISVGDDQNESRTRPLARPLTLWDYLAARGLRAVRTGRNGGYAGSFDWIEGSLALTPGWLRPAFTTAHMFDRLRALRMGA